jgi:hypothetical protein
VPLSDNTDAAVFFSDYHIKLNKALLKKAKSMLSRISKENGKTLDRIIDYPETTLCNR